MMARPVCHPGHTHQSQTDDNLLPFKARLAVDGPTLSQMILPLVRAKHQSCILVNAVLVGWPKVLCWPQNAYLDSSLDDKGLLTESLITTTGMAQCRNNGP